MCNSPIEMVMPGRLHPVTVPCRRCRSCITDCINDHTARGLAEAASREWSVTLTLTYRDQEDGSHERLDKTHFQKALKLLRKRLVTEATKKGQASLVRYVACGEYGSLKGRAHYHVILFGDGPRPDLPQAQRCWPDFWPYGHVYADWNIDAASVRYVMKYLYKWDNDDESEQKWVTRSNRQPLGWDYIRTKVDQYVDAGQMPTNWLYSVPGLPAGKRGRMTDATRRRFVLDLLSKWVLVHGRDVPWSSMSDTIVSGIQRILNECQRHMLTKTLSCAQLLEQIEQEQDRFRLTMGEALRGAQLELDRDAIGDYDYGKAEKEDARLRRAREGSDETPEIERADQWETINCGGLDAFTLDQLITALAAQDKNWQLRRGVRRRPAEKIGRKAIDARRDFRARIGAASLSGRAVEQIREGGSDADGGTKARAAR